MRGPARLAVFSGACAALLTLSACGGPGISGGYTVHSGAEPEGIVRVRYERLECRDAKKTPLSPGPQRIEVIAVDGKEVLVEYRKGFDSMVVDNSFSDRNGKVFQVSLKSDDGRPYLRQYRIPAAGGPGELAVTDDWDHSDTESGFVGKFRRTLLTCTLSPAEP